MKRFSTPTHTFAIPFDTTLIDKMRIIYSQNDDVILCKEVSDCELSGNTIKVTLTQEETALFDCKKIFADIQLHILTTGGDSMVSDIIKVSVEKCLDTEVLE